MSSFTPQVARPSAAPPDPTKHVNYVQGMVLGVDDFTQEFAYLSGRDQWMVRGLIGYGTACGLRVSVDTTSSGPLVAVSAGVGVSPRGQLIRVTPAQCASLNDWLAANKDEVLQHIQSGFGSPPNSSPLEDSVTLYLVLCYRECPTDQVPIPGEPCRSEDDAMAPSRLADDFKLDLRFTPPDQTEEDARRSFVAWFSGQIEITSDAGPFATLAELEALVRAAPSLLSSPAGSPPMFGSPPDVPLRIHPADACEYLQAAFLIWVTELRPLWLGTQQACGTPPDEGCLLLAELDVPLTAQLQVADASQVMLNETRRPYLLPLQLLQDWMLCNPTLFAAGAGGSGPSGSQGAQGGPNVVAAGRFEVKNNSLVSVFAAGNLKAIQQVPANLYLLQFNTFNAKRNYIVKGTPLTDGNIKSAQTFEVVNPTPPRTDGILVRVMQVNNNDPTPFGFMVEISQL